MIIATMHLALTEGTVNALTYLRRSEIKESAVELTLEQINDLARNGLIMCNGDSVGITSCGRLVLDALGKESVCAQ